ncbi:MAG: hypothetical protein EVA89_12720 [Sandaracinaceae bacterium]|nr:MAG: hypothetical protein EVA89_12720 [Sandaracinaceae bacterium]
MHFDDRGTVYSFDAVTGGRLEGSAFLAYRYEPDTRVTPWRMESWVVLPSDNTSLTGERLISLELGIHGYLTRVWRAPGGSVFASDFDGRLYVRDPLGRGWRATNLGPDVQLHGVWGVSDDRYYVWGRGAWGPFIWAAVDGQFQQMPAPPGYITTLRGTSPDLLYAAGRRGLLAKWDGERWTKIELHVLRDLTGLSAGEPNDLWATTESGKLFEGTQHGWALRAQFDGPLFDVVRWAGDVWVAAGRRGLLKLRGKTNMFESRAPDVAAISLSPGADLLAVGEDSLAVSRDGVEFQIVCRHALRSHRQGRPPRWASGARARGHQ